MVIPLPSQILDILLVSNLSIACLLLFTSIYVNSILKLTSLPSLLLLGTLFRVTLNISSTRSILTHGEAGSLIDFFGNSVISGNVVVGCVVFIIITLMQFMVVAKGSERTAEVSARFSLDALPGRQMAIDSDLRSGIISTEDARNKREELQTESKLYAALDGAMKFIKGDVLLGVLITLVNLIAGTLYGYFSFDLEFGELINKFSRLAIGDALVSQIPSLLNAVTAGLMITKVEVKSSIQSETIITQMMQSLESKFILGIILILLSLIPEIPKAITLSLAVGLFISSFFQISKKKIHRNLELVSNFHSIFKISIPANYSGVNITEAQEKFYQSIGFRIYISTDTNATDSAKIFLRDIQVNRLELNSDINQKLFEILNKYAAELLNDQNLKDLIIEKRQIVGDMISSLVPSMISGSRLLRICKLLLAEGLSLRQLDLIIETIGIFANEKEDQVIVAEIRVALKREISDKYSRNFELRGSVLDTAFEKEISVGSSYEAINKLLEKLRNKPEIKLLITSKRSRMGLSDLVKSVNPEIQVIAFEEIDSLYKVLPDEIITII